MRHERHIVGSCCVIAVILITEARGQTISPLDSVRQHFESEAATSVADFEAASAAALAEYEAYVAAARADYMRYADAVRTVWGGGDSIVDNTPTTWVEYADDFRSRSVVDFDRGEAVVEVTLAAAEAADEATVQARLAEAIERMLESRGTTCPYASSVDVSEALTEAPVLDGLVDYTLYNIDTVAAAAHIAVAASAAPPAPIVRGGALAVADRGTPAASAGAATGAATRVRRRAEGGGAASGDAGMAARRDEARRRAADKAARHSAATTSVVDKRGEASAAATTPASDKRSIARAVAAQSTKRQSTLRGHDGQTRTVVSVTMHLVTDNLSKSAALYKDIVAECSERFGIEQPLIFAVIEQESRFNPEATSWVPAYGLMQLVPASGGADAYRYVYKKAWVPTRSYLLVPRQNIELGTAYLRVLDNQFSAIGDPDCRRLCVIASYNTGAGNVSRAFVGTTKLAAALPQINGYNYQQLYNHLSTRLSTDEARNYVVGVSRRREKYLK